MRTSEAELAREMGVHPSTISRFLSGRSKRPGKPFLMALKQVMDHLEAKIRADFLAEDKSIVRSKMNSN